MEVHGVTVHHVSTNHMFFLHLYVPDAKRRKKSVMTFLLGFFLSLCSSEDLFQLSGASQDKNSNCAVNECYIDTSMVVENT